MATMGQPVQLVDKTLTPITALNPLTTGSALTAVSASFTRPNDTNAYSIGDVLANATDGTATYLTFSSTPSDSIMILGASIRIDVASVPAGMGVFRLHLYSSAPTAIADNVAFDLASGDRSKYLGFIEIVTPEDLGSTLWGQTDSINAAFKLATGITSIYAMLETRAAYTPTAQSVATITLKVVNA